MLLSTSGHGQSDPRTIPLTSSPVNKPHAINAVIHNTFTSLALANTNSFARWVSPSLSGKLLDNLQNPIEMSSPQVDRFTVKPMKFKLQALHFHRPLLRPKERF